MPSGKLAVDSRAWKREGARSERVVFGVGTSRMTVTVPIRDQLEYLNMYDRG